jgi:hypothetical protein
MNPNTTNLIPVLRSTHRLILQQHARARNLPQPHMNSTTPPTRWTSILTEQVRKAKLPRHVLEDVQQYLESNKESRRLTIDWRGSMMTQSELIDATAKRVGFIAPKIDDIRKAHETDNTNNKRS